MQPFFSIIVPACNVAPWIEKAIESILRQSCESYEVLFVCEQSSDSTCGIIASFCRKNPQFKLIERERSGSASISRNIGMRQAEGVYLVFLDGDDWLEPDALTDMRKIITDNDFPDMVSGEYRICRGDDIFTDDRTAPHPGRVLSGVDALNLLMGSGSYRSATWRNLYRREFLLSTGVEQSPGRRHQDDEWTPRIFCAADRVVLSDIVFYNYRRRPGSITMDGNAQSCIDITDNTITLLDFITSAALPIELKERIASWQLRTIVNFFSGRRPVSYDMKKTIVFKIFKSKLRRIGLSYARRFSTRGETLFLFAVKFAYFTGTFFALPWIYSILFGRKK